MSVKKLKEQVSSLKLSEVDEDIFGINEADSHSGLKEAGQKIYLIPDELLVDYRDEDFEQIAGRPQPFKRLSDDEMEDLIKSIGENGLIQPITVRPWKDGTYQIIAGRHRRLGCRMNNITEIPSLIYPHIDDTQAAHIMIDTNLKQRQKLSVSERAWAYRLERELQGRHQGKRTDLKGTSCTECTKLDSLAETGEKNGGKRRTVAYYIRLTYLISPLLELLDEDKSKLNIKVAAELSYLREETQQYLYQHILPAHGIKLAQAKELRRQETDAPLKYAVIDQMFLAPQANPKKKDDLRISRELLSGFEGISDDDIKKLFLEFIAQRCYVQ